MKILDRYILGSVAGTFAFGLTMFMVLLLAMFLLKDLIDLIATQNVPVMLALAIFGCKIPGMLVYAFPMAVLLGVLLVFGQMSASSEMVAIRAVGVSFYRVIIPVLIFAVMICGITYFLSDVVASNFSDKAKMLTKLALMQRENKPVSLSHQDDQGRLVYSLMADKLDVAAGEMTKLSFTLYNEGIPTAFIYADKATWDLEKGQWVFHGGRINAVDPRSVNFKIEPNGLDSSFSVESAALSLKEDPFTMSNASKKPEELSSQQMKHLITGLTDPLEITRWNTRLQQRYALPFSCLVFALIGAPLGLRSHRSSSAVGLGVSLIVIFCYYFVAVYLATFSDSGRVSPIAAAWTPNVLGAIFGLFILWRANK